MSQILVDYHAGTFRGTTCNKIVYCNHIHQGYTKGSLVSQDGNSNYAPIRWRVLPLNANGYIPKLSL